MSYKVPTRGGGPRKRQAIGSFPSSVMSVSLSFFHPCWVAKCAYSRSNSSIIWVGTNIGIQTPLDSIFSFDLHQSGKRRRTHLFHSERPNQATKKRKTEGSSLSIPTKLSEKRGRAKQKHRNKETMSKPTSPLVDSKECIGSWELAVS